MNNSTKRNIITLLASLVLLVGCQSLGLTVANMLARMQKPVVVYDIDYGSEERQQLDLYHAGNSTTARPVVVFLYGGAWMQGSKDQYLFVGEALVSKGFVGVIPNYRLFPDVKFPTFVEDSALALKWVYNNIQRFGGDPNDVYIMGHSAGAHIAALLALDERYLRSVGGNKRWLKGMIGLAGPYDWLPYFSASDKQIFGPPSQYPASQPINFVDGDEPRLLLMYGNKDKTVKIRNIDNLAAAIRSKQGKVKTIFYPRLGHIGIVGALSIPLRSRAPVLEDVAAFIYGKPAASVN